MVVGQLLDVCWRLFRNRRINNAELFRNTREALVDGTSELLLIALDECHYLELGIKEGKGVRDVDRTSCDCVCAWASSCRCFAVRLSNSFLRPSGLLSSANSSISAWKRENISCEEERSAYNASLSGQDILCADLDVHAAHFRGEYGNSGWPGNAFSSVLGGNHRDVYLLQRSHAFAIY